MRSTTFKTFYFAELFVNSDCDSDFIQTTWAFMKV